MLTNFEAYLLGRMRAAKLVANAQIAAGITPEECAKKAHRAAEEWGLDRIGYSADVYQDAIGKPVSEQVLSEEDTGLGFAGSICRLYALPLWPKVLFRVNQHPSGYAWGEGFVQGPLVGPMPSPSAIEPWEWVADTIEASASRIERVEHWTDEKDLRLVFDRGGSISAASTIPPYILAS